MPQQVVDSRRRRAERGGDHHDSHPIGRGGAKSFVDDLVLGRGVVLSRAATSLRSIETQPWTRRFVRIQTGTSPKGPFWLLVLFYDRTVQWQLTLASLLNLNRHLVCHFGLFEKQPAKPTYQPASKQAGTKEGRPQSFLTRVAEAEQRPNEGTRVVKTSQAAAATALSPALGSRPCDLAAISRFEPHTATGGRARLFA